MRPLQAAGRAPKTPTASHEVTRAESTGLPPAMAALGGDYIAELALSRPQELACALRRLAAEARATASSEPGWALWRRAYEKRAERLRADRLRGCDPTRSDPTAGGEFAGPRLELLEPVR